MVIRWDKQSGQWTATTSYGTVVRSKSKTELEAFLDRLEHSQEPILRDRIATRTAAVYVSVCLGVLFVLAWLWWK